MFIDTTVLQFFRLMDFALQRVCAPKRIALSPHICPRSQDGHALIHLSFATHRALSNNMSLIPPSAQVSEDSLRAPEPTTRDPTPPKTARERFASLLRGIRIRRPRVEPPPVASTPVQRGRPTTPPIATHRPSRSHTASPVPPQSLGHMTVVNPSVPSVNVSGSAWSVSDLTRPRRGRSEDEDKVMHGAGARLPTPSVVLDPVGSPSDSLLLLPPLPPSDVSIGSINPFSDPFSEQSVRTSSLSSADTRYHQRRSRDDVDISDTESILSSDSLSHRAQRGGLNHQVDDKSVRGHYADVMNVPLSRVGGNGASEELVLRREAPGGRLQLLRRRRFFPVTDADAIDRETAVLDDDPHKAALYGAPHDHAPRIGRSLSVYSQPYYDIVAPSELPRVHIKTYARAISTKSFGVFGSYLTHYRDLCAAETDTDFELVQARPEREWQLSLTVLLAVVAVDATVFGFASTGTLFTTNTIARRACSFSTLARTRGSSRSWHWTSTPTTSSSR
ncbi:unnamed protein product [Peniophora sp. CBMAI 1063]|nr:unnamed protein product [Peniophora sp. CBMAI 1063]